MKRNLFLSVIIASVSTAVAAESNLENPPNTPTVSQEKSAIPKEESIAAPVETVEKTGHQENKSVQKPEPAKEISVAPIAPVQELLGFHEREMASIKKLMERWNEKLGGTLKRRQEMEQDITAMNKQIESLQKEGSKKSKNEAVRLTKNIGRLNKDIKGLDNQMKSQTKELAGELREISREAQTALKDAYQQAITDIQKPRP